MDIILPFSADRLNGLELKYAIRSIRKHLTGFDGIYIIGDRPKEDGIIHIQATDVPGRKEKVSVIKYLKPVICLKYQKTSLCGMMTIFS